MLKKLRSSTSFNSNSIIKKNVKEYERHILKIFIDKIDNIPPIYLISL